LKIFIYGFIRKSAMPNRKSTADNEFIPNKEQLNELNEDLKNRLISTGIKIPNLAMPRCADLYTSTIDNSSFDEPDPDEIAALFEEYFTRDKHLIFESNIKGGSIVGYKDENIDRGFRCKSGTLGVEDPRKQDSSDCCLPCSCITLWGNRRLLVRILKNTPIQTLKIRRLYFGDLVWLFFMERLGTFNILAVLLDDFATNGKYPFDIFDVSSIILNTLVEHTKMGLTSRVRDRESAYMRALGWKQPHLRRETDRGKVIINAEMNKLLHNFISLVLEWYKDRHADEAIQGVVSRTTPSSTASLVAISERIKQIKIASEAFNYGRITVVTLNGILEVIVTFALLFRVRDKLGVPQTFTKLDDITPAVIEKLGLEKNVANLQVNTFSVHHDAAKELRDILLDLEVLDFEDLDELTSWLYLSQAKFEGFRRAYLDITNIDLAKPEYRTQENMRIEQQV
jgi:hypothetical protein